MSDDTQEVLLEIYDSVADQTRWSSVLDKFVERVGAQGSIIFDWEEAEGRKRLTAPLFSGFYSADVLAAYLQKCAHLEAQDQAVLRQHTSDQDQIDVIDDTILAASLDDLVQQEHVKKLKKLGISRRAAGVLNKDNRWISLFSVQFHEERAPLGEQERQYMAKLLPHIAKAHDLGLPLRQLASQNDGALAAIDRLSIGICVLDPKGLIVVRNEEFIRQQETYRTFQLTPQGVLRLANDADQKKFEALMVDVRSHGNFGARPRKEAIATTLDNFLCIEVTPLNRSEEIGSKTFGGFIVYSTDTSLPVRCNTAPIKSAFGLTNTELSLVEAIGEGLTNPEIAEHRSRSVATINSQVKSILAKTQCATRTQFVRMMMRFGVSFLSTRG